MKRLLLGRPFKNSIKWFIGGAFILFVCCAMTVSLVLSQRLTQLEQSSTYNGAFIASQGSLEMMRLQNRALLNALGGGNVDKDDVQLSLDILAGRVETLQNSDMFHALQGHAGISSSVENLDLAINRAQESLNTLEGKELALSIHRLFTPYDVKMGDLISASNLQTADSLAVALSRFEQLQVVSLIMIGALAVGGVLLIALLWWLQRSEQTARLQNTRFDAALTNMTQALCMTNADHKLVVCNARFQTLFGLKDQQVLPGTLMRDVFSSIRQQGRYCASLIDRLEQAQKSTTGGSEDYVFEEGNHDSRWIEASHQVMVDGGLVATYEDVTERRRVESRISYMAHHDALTSLPNRVQFQERMTQALRAKENFAVLYLDLDHFKDINDTLGHPVGDVLLKEVAQRLRACVREDDTVARLGGDEFAIIQANVSDRHESAILAQRLIETICEPYTLSGQQMVIGTSIGVAMAPVDGHNPEELMKNADLALYEAKETSRRTYCFFDPEMSRSSQERLILENDLRSALARSEELEVFYQPQGNLDANKVVGCEALIRWRHPTRGMISPMSFVPLAERVGLIGPLGEWVLRQACLEAMHWDPTMRVAVNLSPAQFKHSNVPHMVARALADSGLAPHRLELEITEALLMQDEQSVMDALKAIKALGVRIALDDFGTGYSSLSYLVRFPFDKIKIDRSFVSATDRPNESLAIVRSITSLAKELGMTTVAEGVETEDQLEQMRTANCTDIQGYFLGKPLPKGELRPFLAQPWGLTPQARRSVAA